MPAELGAPEPLPAAIAGTADTSTSHNVADVADSAAESVRSARISESERTPPTDPDAADPSRVTAVRRGLPRVPGGEPWPPASELADPEHGGGSGRIGEIDPDPLTLSGSATESASQNAADLADVEPSLVPGGPAPTGSVPAPTGSVPVPARSVPAPAGSAPAPAAARPPLAVPKTAWPGAAASSPRPVRSEPRRIGPYTPLQWLGSTAVLGVFALALAGIVVLLARFALAIGPGRDFLAAFPGEYPLPASAPVGLPVWLNWSHFLNSFFLLFIIRSGWQVRREKRPAAFWSPRTNKKRRISLALWFHQAIDILWIANGVIFVVLLFATGQWMRIVPTSWEVFPNALSAALQYASLDWPTENGWVNYNSLQQLSYFAITFVAAPLAILSGVRLSGVWPKDAEKLNRLYPLEWARRIHFPVMLFFVAFIVVHVGLVLATGALRNLNHMYAARGSVDPEAFTGDPTGLLIFAASLLVMAGGWVAARPRVLVPIARLFGDVKQR